MIIVKQLFLFCDSEPRDTPRTYIACSANCATCLPHTMDKR